MVYHSKITVPVACLMCVLPKSTTKIEATGEVIFVSSAELRARRNSLLVCFYFVVFCDKIEATDEAILSVYEWYKIVSPVVSILA
jgi:hypothetical protein